MAARRHVATAALGMWRRVKHVWEVTVVEPYKHVCQVTVVEHVQEGQPCIVISIGV